LLVAPYFNVRRLIMSDNISIYLRSNAEGVISISIDIPIGLVQSMKTKSVAEPTEVLMSQLAENWMSSEPSNNN